MSRKGHTYTRAEITDLLGNECPVDKNGTPVITAKKTEFTQPWAADWGASLFNIVARFTNRSGIVPKGRGWGSDDYTYNFYPTLRKILPRGLGTLRWTEGGEVKTFRYHMLEKFTSFEAFDEDSGIKCDKGSLIDARKGATEVAVLRKANGKAALAVAVEIHGVQMILVGSKNVHLPMRWEHLDEDLAWHGENNPGLAHEIAEKLVSIIKKMTAEQRTGFYTKIREASCCTEYEDGKHMVPLKEPRHVCFGFVPHAIGSGADICQDFRETERLIQSFGLPHVEVEVMTPEEFESRREELRWEHGTEGYVIHWRHVAPDGKVTVIEIEKFKTWWYVFVRMLRQFIDSRNGLDYGWELRLAVRFMKRNTDYMKLPDKALLVWYKMAHGFIDWFLQKGFDKSIVMFDKESLGMGTVWKMFTDETGTNDNAFDYEERIEGEVNFAAFTARIEDKMVQARELQDAKGIFVVVMGPPGTGKDTLFDEVAKTNSSHVKAISQDHYLQSVGKKKARGETLKRVGQLMDAKTPIVVLKRCNTTIDQWKAYNDLARSKGYYIVAMPPLHAGPAYVLTCLQSSLARKKGEKESSLAGEPLSVQTLVVLRFSALAQYPDRPNLLIDRVIPIQWLKTDYAHTALPEGVWEYFDEYRDEIREAADLGDFNPGTLRDEAELVEKLALKNPAYTEGRTPLAELVKTVRKQFDSLIGRLNRHQLKVPVPEPPVPLYIGLFWAKEVTGQLRRVASSHPKVNLKTFKRSRKYASHITCIHKNDYAANVKLLKELMGRIGQTFKVSVTHIAWNSGEMLVLVVSLTNPKGESMDHLICSGHGHITMELNTKYKPAQSIDFVKDLRAGSDVGELIELEKPFVFDATIKTA